MSDLTVIDVLFEKQAALEKDLSAQADYMTYVSDETIAQLEVINDVIEEIERKVVE